MRDTEDIYGAKRRLTGHRVQLAERVAQEPRTGSVVYQKTRFFIESMLNSV
jgi:hypothetical protein